VVIFASNLHEETNNIMVQAIGSKHSAILWAGGRRPAEASGRAGERASGRAGERASGRAGERASGRAGERAADGGQTAAKTQKPESTTDQNA